VTGFCECGDESLCYVKMEFLDHLDGMTTFQGRLCIMELGKSVLMPLNCQKHVMIDLLDASLYYF
jgi:hypothetical protein